jgi:hypothetical protein
MVTTINECVMKKLPLIMGAVAVAALLGAGCAEQPAAQAPQPAATNTAPGQTAPKTVGAGELKDLPAVKSLPDPFDDSSWVTTTTKTGVALKAPVKGTFAPTWTYTLLKNDDPHLNGNCYVTEDTVYKRTEFTGYESGSACQTTTALNPGPGVRTDYFVFHNGYENSKGVQVTETHLFTFTKTYPAGFDMDTYGATIERVINIID